MDGIAGKVKSNTLYFRSYMNEELAFYIIQEAIRCGVAEFCICPGNRNAPLYQVLMQAASLTKYFWYEERSAAFFALGRARATSRPVAVITTSGSAAGELLPATMEAYYTGTPLLLITADRPRRFRGSGAPQTAEQVGLFSCYTPFNQDIAWNTNKESIRLGEWDHSTPAHLNVCFEEPFPKEASKCPPSASVDELIALSSSAQKNVRAIPKQSFHSLNQFLEKAKYPLVVVSSLKPEAKEGVIQFIQKLNAPVFLEGISGIREDPRLQQLRIIGTDRLWKTSAEAGYPIDALLRIGGVPTFRMWRDIEEKEGQIAVCSINDVPFSGLSWGEIIHAPLDCFFSEYKHPFKPHSSRAAAWLQSEREYQEKLLCLFDEEPFAEQSLVHKLSQTMPPHSLVYLGNSLPIREWDLAATSAFKNLSVQASRGINGIDGQISTFLGLCHSQSNNWGIFGDLTTLYDLAAPWVLPQLKSIRVNIVVINNGGGQIFSKFLPDKEFLNTHSYHFGPIAEMWGLRYERWSDVSATLSSCEENRLIEVVPNGEATQRFQQKLITGAGLMGNAKTQRIAKMQR